MKVDGQGSSTPLVSVVVPTHNPRRDYLQRVVEALSVQSLPSGERELLVIDNCSRERVDGWLDLSWQPGARVLREERLGLTFARLRGFSEARGRLIVMVDDDNVVAPDYLANAIRIATCHPTLGAFGGRVLPEYEVAPEPWIHACGKGLGLRDLGREALVFPESPGDPEVEGEEAGRGKFQEAQSGKVRMFNEFPDCAPIGAGMVLCREAARFYAERFATAAPGGGIITDRIGDSLASGGDNDICLTVLEGGWQVGYFPELRLTHLIPSQRLTLSYQKRMARESMRSFVLMLDRHGMRPWPAMPAWTVPLRVARDWARVRPWICPERALRWSTHRGCYEARARLRP